MDAWEKIAEEKIRAAQEAGVFDDLPGKGQPLRLEEFPFEAEESHLAHHLLRSGGYSLPWIEFGQQIESERLALRRALREAGGSPSAQGHFLRQIAALNQQILEYNIRVPHPTFQRRPLDGQAELLAALQPPKA